VKSLKFLVQRGLVAMTALALCATAVAQSGDKPFSNEQLDQMTAQVALYPDSLLAQLFMATTYPDEFASATAWSKAHPDAKGDDAVKMVENETWDPSVQSMVAFPEVLITLGDKPEWVKNMGDAFLAQPDEVMDSVQRLRGQAQKAGNLKSNEQIKVSTQAPDAAPPPAAPTTTVVQQVAPQPPLIVIEPAQPSVVYVPAYNPTIVYGAWPYPAYPPYYYPPPPGYWWSRTIATGIAWGVGIGVTNALWGGCHWGWGHSNVDINVNRYNNINVNRRLDVNSSRTSWNHNTEHRGNTPYRGGDATRRNLDNKYQAGNREQFRGKDASRDASRDRASQAMQSRGVDAGSGTARERAQSANRDMGQQRAQNVDRGAAQQKAQNVDRSAARQNVQSADHNAARQNAQASSRDNALKGANSSQARAQADRGAASQAAAQRTGGSGGARASTASSAGGARAASGGGGGRPGGGGGGRPSGGGGGRGR
jgi:hypothetical protein